MGIRENLQSIRQRMAAAAERAGRDPAEVLLVATAIALGTAIPLMLGRYL